ncbi:putative lipoprotein [Corallococcus coralloides DSM 2259]|uniref:Putative lipoprotein n=1 Tax=Corallococcus coralloides (strain ATCC 25202 / DSM 2259 / NBRC 100086 / M2) TaxID=1144275 RepID=H8MQ29_CORCM|nr:hypothetical protein [Corallococcus coralloides]AFE06838.1 putative lipoprotein [Corallococcus coralloides DSM 2259]
MRTHLARRGVAWSLGLLGLFALACQHGPDTAAKAPRPAWMPPEGTCPRGAQLQMERLGLKVGDRIPVIVDSIQDHPGPARYNYSFVIALPQAEGEAKLPGARIGGRLYVTKHRVFGRYDRIFTPESGATSVPFCGVLLDTRWDRDGEGLIAYPSPMKGFSVVQDNTGVIQVVDRYP